MSMGIERMRIADFHQDRLNPQLSEILLNPEFKYAAERQKQLPRLGLKILDLTFASIYRRANEQIQDAAATGNEDILGPVREDYHRIIDYYHATKEFRVIEKPEDLQLQETYDANNVVLHLESGDIITDPEIVDELYERGVRSIGPLYSHDNQLGGGARGDKERGLTTLGKSVIDRITARGMVVDVAHANRKTAQDIIERVGAYQKIAATHTTPGENERLISPELIREIAKRGGVVGLTPATPFFSSFQRYLESFKAVSDMVGTAEHVAVATDFGGIDAKHLFTELSDLTKLSLLAERLSETGSFSDEDIAKILYGNVERIVKQL